MHAFRCPAVATDLGLFGVALPRFIANTAAGVNSANLDHAHEHSRWRAVLVVRPRKK